MSSDLFICMRSSNDTQPCSPFLSGLSVQNPGRSDGNEGGAGGVASGAAELVKNLLRQAAAGGTAPPPQAEQRPRAFFGGGHTLGSEDTESTYVPDPSGANNDDEEGQFNR